MESFELASLQTLRTLASAIGNMSMQYVLLAGRVEWAALRATAADVPSLCAALAPSVDGLGLDKCECAQKWRDMNAVFHYSIVFGSTRR
jgi:hypothetical protein